MTFAYQTFKSQPSKSITRHTRPTIYHSLSASQEATDQSRVDTQDNSPPQRSSVALLQGHTRAFSVWP